MVAYWRANGFKEVILVDAKDFDDANQPGAYVDSTAFSLRNSAGLHPGGARSDGQSGPSQPSAAP
jgi:phosphoketolase